jgi:hypothetical protein
LHVFASLHYLVFIPNSTILELTGILAHFHSARCCLWDGHGRLREGGWPGGIPCLQQRFQLWGWKAWRCHQNGWANEGQTQPLGQAQAIWPGCLAMPEFENHGEWARIMVASEKYCVLSTCAMCRWLVGSIFMKLHQFHFQMTTQV